MENKPKCIITVGISASGKTSWAESQPMFNILCRDNIRRDLLCVTGVMGTDDNLWRYYDFRKYEDEVQKYWENQFLYFTNRSIDFIIADTNLNSDRRNALIRRLENADYEVEIKDFPITFEEAVKHDLKRRDTVGKDVLYKQWQNWINYLVETGQKQKYSPSAGLRNAIICDIDGTLAHMGDRRGPFEWNKVHLDAPDITIRSILENHYDNGYSVILVSGRDSVCLLETYKWLHMHDIPYTQLFMRAEGDMRKDAIVKEEIFWRDIAPNYNVRLVIDDRPQVCRMWMDLGLKVLNVGNPYVEF